MLFVLYLALAVGARTALQLIWTGSSGHQHKRPARMVEWVGQGLFAVSLGLFLVAPVLDLTRTIDPVAALDGRTARVAGIVLYGLGLAGTLVAQIAMGRSWRIGVDGFEKTDLVTGGPFALVRNPIFSAMLFAFLGLTLMVPSGVAFAGLLGLLTAVELQVRFVEEPYLMRTHSAHYAGYASRIGRFLPGVGKLKARSESS